MRLLDRLATAWRTLRDTDGAHLLLQGPLPGWMQDRFEREAARRGVDVGQVIFYALRDAAEQLPDGMED